MGVTIMVGSNVIVAASPLATISSLEEEPTDAHLDFFAQTATDRAPSGTNSNHDDSMEYEEYEEDEEGYYEGGEAARTATEQFRQAKLRRLNSSGMDPLTPSDDGSVDDQRRRRQQVRFVSTHHDSAPREGGISPTDTNDTAAPPSRGDSPSQQEEEEEL